MTNPQIPAWVHMADVPPPDEPQRPKSGVVASFPDPEPAWALWGDSGAWLGAVIVLLAFAAGVVTGVLVSR